MTRSDPAEASDLFADGRLRIRQPAQGHRSGTDAMLLAGATTLDGVTALADLGAGTGVVGLVLALRALALNVVLVEHAPLIAAMARENIAANALAARVRVIEADITARAPQRHAAGLAARSVDAVVMNPPFLPAGAGRPSPDADRRKAHVLGEGDLARWFATAADMLRRDGALTLIQRADQTAMVLQALEGRFGGIVILPVHPRVGQAASRVLVTARPGSRAPLRIAPALVLHGDDGRFTVQAEALHRGEPLGPWCA